MTELTWLVAIILGLVEGITEFLPISSTGHLVIAGALLDYHGEQADALEIVIQGAAILAVCWEYRLRLASTALTFMRDDKARRFLFNLVLGFLPLAILGLAFQKTIKAYLFRPLPVALAFVVGGVLILLVDRRENRAVLHEPDEVAPLIALKLGFWQALALFPGTSRAAATIIGGMLMGMSRRLATEYSFFLAIPTLLAATAYELLKHWRSFDTGSSAGPVLLSALIAFATAFLAVRALLRYISTHTFAVFAWYRIAFGLLIIATSSLGWVRW